jgi:hypothetical protein
MRLDSLKTLRRLATAALFVLAVDQYVALRTARAGCSHLVVSQTERSFHFNRLDTLIVGAPLTAAPFDQSPQPAPARRPPCSGPSCSSRVPFPLPGATEGSSGLDQWAACTLALAELVIAPAGRTTDDRTPRSIVRKPSIFHPPPA